MTAAGSSMVTCPSTRQNARWAGATSRAATTTTPWPASCCGTWAALPVAGERLAWRDLSIEVVDMDGLVIDKLLVTPRSSQGLHARRLVNQSCRAWPLTDTALTSTQTAHANGERQFPCSRTRDA